MSRTRNRMIVAAVAAVSLITGAVITTAFAGAGPRSNPVQYSAPYACGWLPPVPPDLDQHLKPGNYATSIQIHNVTSAKVNGTKKVAFSGRMGAPTPPVNPNFSFSVARDRVLEIDCVDIWAMASLPPGTFISGSVHIGLNSQLPVTGIYTSQTHSDPNLGHDAGAGHSIDVEIIEPFTLVTT